MYNLNNNLKFCNCNKYLNLLNLINNNYSNGGIESLYLYLKNENFNISFPSFLINNNYRNKIIYIEYNKQCNNCCIWTKKTRNIIIALDEINNKWIYIKYLINYEPHDYINNKEDFGYKVNKLDYLSKNHYKILDDIYNNNYNKCWLSLNKDGILIGIHVYLFDSIEGKIVINIINNYGDDFSKMLLNYCKNKNLLFFIIISNSETLLISELIQQYFVTSLLCGMFNMNKELLTHEVLVNNFKPHELLLNNIDKLDKFIDSINKFCKIFLNVIKKTPLYLSFESVCSNKIDLYNHLHNELDKSYSTSSFMFLGITIFNDIYLPYFLCHNKNIFQCPLYISTTINELSTIIYYLSNIITNKLSENEFICNYEICNSFTYTIYKLYYFIMGIILLYIFIKKTFLLPVGLIINYIFLFLLNKIKFEELDYNKVVIFI